MLIPEIIVLLSAYLIGSISSAVIVCNIMGLDDPRGVGSHNPGATNVFRIGGKKAAVLTFLGDIVKGIIPVAIGKYLDISVIWLSGIAISAFLGHCLPLFFSFAGGKGVATAFGAVSTINWHIGIIILFIWLLAFILFRISSVASISAAISLPIASWYFSPSIVIPMFVLATLMIWRHHENIQNLISGDETNFKKTD